MRRTRSAAVGLMCAALVGSTAGAGDGDIDWGFGAGQGGVELPLPPGTTGWSEGVRIRVQTDGRILVLAQASLDGDGTSESSIVYRLLPSGQLDTSFGSGGMAVVSSGPNQWSAALELGPGGTVYLGGTRGGSPSAMLVVRLLADGTVDPTYGVSGVAAVSFPGGLHTWLFDLVAWPDGSVTAAGETLLSGSRSDMVFAKLDSVGDLDPGFGAGGLSSAQLGPQGALQRYCAALDLTALPDGRVMVAGRQDTELLIGPDAVFFSQWVMARLGTNGSFDATFNGIGYRTGAFLELDTAADFQRLARVELLPNGAYIGVGSYESPVEKVRGALVKVLEDGSMDLGWGTSGAAGFEFDPASLTSPVGGSAIDTAGRLLLVGGVELVVDPDYGYTDDFVGYARVLTGGPSYDSRFRGGNDYFYLPPEAEGGNSDGNDIAVDSHGRILVVGTRWLGSRRASIRRLEGGLPFQDGFESGELEAWSAVHGGL